MTVSVTWGVGSGLDGREAVFNALQQAYSLVSPSTPREGREPSRSERRPALAIVFISQEYDVEQTLASLKTALGNTPVWGFSTVRPLTHQGDHPRSVVVALFTSPDIKARINWFADLGRDHQIPRQITALKEEWSTENPPIQGVMLAMDGITGGSQEVINALQGLHLPVAGGLASGDYQAGKTWQIGGQAGCSSLSALLLSGRFTLGVGMAHAWRPLGMQYTVTRSSDLWVQGLDGSTPAEVYQKIFNYPAREWAFPPLTSMARLYPFLLPSSSGDSRLAAPLRVEVDGSFRMNIPVQQGQTVQISIGNPQACQTAMINACQQALDGLQGAKPLAAVLMVDVAWQMLLQNRLDAVIESARSVLGELPMVGASTLGQVGGAIDHPTLLNNSVTVAILGERER